MATSDKTEFALGEVFTFAGVVDAAIQLIDYYSRWEVLLSLQHSLPFLSSPATPLVLLIVALILVQRGMQKRLTLSISNAQTSKLQDEHGQRLTPEIKVPSMKVTYGVVFTGLLAACVLAVVWLMTYSPHVPTMKARIDMPTICKTADCFPSTPQPQVKHIVNQYGPFLVSNQGSISGGVKIDNSGIIGTPPKQRVSLFGNGSQLGSLELDNVHLEFYFSWELFLDDLEASSGDRAKIKKVVDDMVTQMNPKTSSLTCRGQIEGVAKAAMAYAVNEAPLVQSLRRNRPSCFVP